MFKQYTLDELRDEVETRGPKNIQGFHLIDIERFGINPDFQDLGQAAKLIPEDLEALAWELTYG